MIRNKTQKTIVSKQPIFCKSIWCKASGLMFSRQKDLIFIFNKPQKVSLHMFFVFYPIDVLYADQDKKVVELKESFNPFTTYHPQQKASYVIELQSGTIQKTKTKLNDILEF